MTDAEDAPPARHPVEVIVDLAHELEKIRRERIDARPGTDEEEYLSGVERGLRMALLLFERLDEFQQGEHLPEWQIGLENRQGEWEWYYPHAATRHLALEKAREEARDDLGDGHLHAYEVGGPIAE